MPKKSNFFALDDATRKELFSKYDVFFWETTQVFGDVGDDAWWQSEDGFHFVPESYEDGCIHHIFEAIGVDAQALAAAVYPARKQHARVVDPCLIFLDMHCDAMKVLCLYQIRPNDFLGLSGEKTVQAARAHLSGLLGESFQEVIDDHLRDVFPVWAGQFMLQLVRWKAPNVVEQVGDESPDSATGSAEAPGP